MLINLGNWLIDFYNLVLVKFILELWFLNEFSYFLVSKKNAVGIFFFFDPYKFDKSPVVHFGEATI